jgi:hypothetical protein
MRIAYLGTYIVLNKTTFDFQALLVILISHYQKSFCGPNSLTSHVGLLCDCVVPGAMSLYMSSRSPGIRPDSAVSSSFLRDQVKTKVRDISSGETVSLELLH